MSKHFSNKRILGLIIGLGTAAMSLGGVYAAGELTHIESYAATAVSWNSLSLDTDGSAAWDVGIPSGEAVDSYEIRLSRQKDGNWTENYKTYKTSDNSYQISFSSKGKYHIKIRVKFIGGAYSDWSFNSPDVNITADDIDSDSPSGGNNYYYNYGYGYYPMGPGSGSDYGYYGPKGPGEGSYSNTSVINTVTGSYVNGNAGKVNVQYQNPGSQNTASGWIKEGNGYYYRYGNGTYARNGWERIDNYWYYFDANGLMKTSWIYVNNKWYYALPSGRLATSSWNNINEKWYYFDNSGIMQTGYINVDGKTYYTDSSGARVQSAYNPDGHLFDLNGVMIR